MAFSRDIVNNIQQRQNISNEANNERIIYSISKLQMTMTKRERQSEGRNICEKERKKEIVRLK